MDLIAVGEEGEAFPTDGFLHVDGKLEFQAPDVARALLEAADRIAEHVAKVVDAVRDAASGERRANASRVAEVARKIDRDRFLRNAGNAIGFLLLRLRPRAP